MKKEEKKINKKTEFTDKKVNNKKVDTKKNDIKKADNKKGTTNKSDTKKRDKYIAEKKSTIKEKSKKENIFKRILKYFKGVLKETKRIRWTTGKELVRYSIAAISFVLFFGIYFYGIKWISVLVRDFDEIIELIRSLVK